MPSFAQSFAHAKSSIHQRDSTTGRTDAQTFLYVGHGTRHSPRQIARHSAN
jgi:hypothetical protein